MVNKKALVKDINIIDNKYLCIVLENEQTVEYRAGQYIVVIFSKSLRRSYSIASFGKKEFLVVIELDDGYGARAAMKLSISESIDFIGPVGNFFYRENGNFPIFISTGIGITPIKSIIEYLYSKNNNDMKLFWGVKKKSDLIFNFDYLKENFIPVISGKNEDFSNKGYVTDYLMDHIDDFKHKDFYICGDPNIVNSIKDYLQSNFDVNKENIYTEKF